MDLSPATDQQQINMFKKTVASVFLLFSAHAFGFEIYALGTSNTNCKNAGQAYTSRLNELFKENYLDATVVNGGVDGDKPNRMLDRLHHAITINTKIVIFEPGPNDRDKNSNVEYLEKILEQLKQQHITTIYVSHGIIQTTDEAESTAKKYNAYYYGHWTKNVPVTTTYRQFDVNGNTGGHMTVEGCKLWAENMFQYLILAGIIIK